MAQAQQTILYRHFTQVHSLHLDNTTTRYLGTLMKSSNAEFPLPGLETLHLRACEFKAENDELFQTLKDLLKERKELGKPLRTATLERCTITAEGARGFHGS
ncbi:hypothetical protein BDN71DRAFT_1031359 [Pleurotus eryngii]|uniref:Uncharacterized protein n=1 Tax=Pleurotus eryngii TaxID=5323 RepID=A0A9P6A7N9_PLEER|nr:hypothetical protein BDN71DRAFT_1031359 [Pleurotus eryngii]